MPKLPKINPQQRTVVTSAMRLIKSVLQSRKTQQQADLLSQIPTNVSPSLLADKNHD